MKQNIIYYWLEDNKILDNSKIDEVLAFCNENKYIPRWRTSNKVDWLDRPIKGCWSIGIFESENSKENIDNIANFASQYSCRPPTKISKSRNHVQLKDILKSKFRGQLRDIEKELKYEKNRENKENPQFHIDDVISQKDYEELENIYRYKLNVEEKKNIEKVVFKYIDKHSYLKEYLIK